MQCVLACPCVGRRGRAWEDVGAACRLVHARLLPLAASTLSTLYILLLFSLGSFPFLSVEKELEGLPAYT